MTMFNDGQWTGRLGTPLTPHLYCLHASPLNNQSSGIKPQLRSCSDVHRSDNHFSETITLFSPRCSAHVVLCHSALLLNSVFAILVDLTVFASALTLSSAILCCYTEALKTTALQVSVVTSI